ncbi:MAG: hemerythrin family protein [Magnetococcales bacterium]|nr:hemerythrin family protein [Magnetococcales bacterium]
MQWDKKLELGIDSIDRQHRAIIERINRLEIALNSSVTSVTVPRLLEVYDYLDQYIATHFREEEELMAQNNYPNLEAHKALHHGFEAELAKLRDSLEGSGLISYATAQLVGYLGKWFITHIQGEDPKYVSYIKK